MKILLGVNVLYDSKVQKMVLYGVMYLYIGQWDCNDVTVLGHNLFLIFA